MTDELPTVNDLFPAQSRLLLTGGGKEFIERIGVDAARRVVLGVMMGENVRTQTEPLTRRRIAQITGALVFLFAQGAQSVEDFTGKLSEMAAQMIEAEIVRMSMQHWPRDLAQRLGRRLGFSHELQSMPDERIGAYLHEKLMAIPI